MTNGHPSIGAVGRHAELDRVPNNMFERAAGSHALAAACGIRSSPDKGGLQRDGGVATV